MQRVHPYIIDRPAAYADPDFMDGTEACAGKDPEMFFPVRAAYAEHLDAIRICRGCPLRTACGTWALNTGQEYGVYGGMTPRQRRQILRRNGDPR